MKIKEYTTEVGGKKWVAIFSDLTNQADGSVILSCGDTKVLATAVMTKHKTDTSWFNLTVDYVEKFYAAGKIGGGRFMKREGKPSDEAVLSSRVIDRTIRPLFNHDIKNGVQIITTVLSMDDSIDPGILAINAASIAIATSDIPWDGPVGAVRMGEFEGNIIVNSSQKDREAGYDYDLIVCGKGGRINMIEASAYQIPEDVIANGFERAQVEINKLEAWQNELIKAEGKEKRVIEIEKITDERKELFEKEIMPKMEEYSMTKEEGGAGMHELQEIWEKLLGEKYPEEEKFGKEDGYFHHKLDEFVHMQAIENNKRADGRAMDQVRGLYAQAGEFSKVLHGSGIFYRGGTHTFTALTLGGPEDAQLIDGMEVSNDKRFMHHYNFPPYSVGDTGRATFTNRREVGHGVLAEKALSVVLPSKDEFPYTIRLVSEAMASNGSTSQGAICASTLALMDGGVPIKAPVAGVAMGLMYKDEDNYKILTDIQGPEDHYGDMDFKCAGSEKGVTAIQLDVKVEGVSVKILTEAMMQNKAGRQTILDRIKEAIAEPRTELAENAPKIVMVSINPDSIGKVIGSGGKVIKDIKERTDTEISVEDDGSVYITGKGEGPEEAKKIIENITHEWNIGDVTSGEVTGIKEFGAFVKLMNGEEGMAHISELADFRVEKVEDYLKEGQIVPVKVIKKERGKIGLSIKAADKDFIKKK